MFRYRLLAFLALLLLAFLVPGVALAATDVIPGPGDVASQPGDVNVLNGLSVEQLAAAFVTNIAGYALNYFGPQISQQAKGSVILLLNVAVGVVIMAIEDGTFGFNTQTLVMVLTAVVSAAIAHGVLKPTGLAFYFGAGRNKPGQPPVNTEKTLFTS